MTTITSSTVISGMSSVFTLFLSHVISKEPLTLTKVLGVAACVVGTCLVGLADKDSSHKGKHNVLGDAICLASSFFYACYTVTLRYNCPDELSKRMPMTLMFGCLGVRKVCSLCLLTGSSRH